MPLDFQQIEADEQLEEDFRHLVRLAVREDFAGQPDWTTESLVPVTRRGHCHVVAREAGICAGLVTLPWIASEMNLDVHIETSCSDGAHVRPGQSVASIEGAARDILSSERIVLNTLCRLFGIASYTNEFVARLAGSGARLYDTRKTTLGWRRLDKYAVRCGGGTNHRTGLYDAILIKDNHLALAGNEGPISAGDAAKHARDKCELLSGQGVPRIVEIEVDTISQLKDVLPQRPDIVLLDNFSNVQLKEAVALRDAMDRDVQLEASGNVKLETIAEIASTGVDRISSGALTHAARWLDLGLDWHVG